MKKEVKTSIDGLELGMYIARLDKPWLKTPYELEGVKIKSLKDIERLRKYCNYVYVDIEQGYSPDPRFWVVREGPKVYATPPRPITEQKTVASPEAHNEYTALRKNHYQDATAIEEEYFVAEQAHERLQEDFHKVMDKLGQSNEFEIEELNASISGVVDSVIRAPGAMTLVIKLKQFDDSTYTRALGTSVWCATFGRHLGLEKPSIESLALIELSTGEMGAVISVNGLRRLRPSVMLLLDSNKEPLQQFRLVDFPDWMTVYRSPKVCSVVRMVSI